MSLPMQDPKRIGKSLMCQHVWWHQKPYWWHMVVNDKVSSSEVVGQQLQVIYATPEVDGESQKSPCTCLRQRSSLVPRPKGQKDDAVFTSMALILYRNQKKKKINQGLKESLIIPSSPLGTYTVYLFTCKDKCTITTYKTALNNLNASK